jgi:hypothetical protein
MTEQLIVFAMLHLVATCVSICAAICMALWGWLRRSGSRYRARHQLKLLLVEAGFRKDDPSLQQTLDDYGPRKPN